MSLHAIEPTRSRGQLRVDGVESPRHRADAATEARRVDGVGRPKFDFHTGPRRPDGRNGRRLRGVRDRNARSALAEGLIDEALIDERLVNLFKVRLRLGHFDLSFDVEKPRGPLDMIPESASVPRRTYRQVMKASRSPQRCTRTMAPCRFKG